jgi:hypothetical protein
MEETKRWQHSHAPSAPCGAAAALQQNSGCDLLPAPIFSASRRASGRLLPLCLCTSNRAPYTPFEMSRPRFGRVDLRFLVVWVLTVSISIAGTLVILGAFHRTLLDPK